MPAQVDSLFTVRKPAWHDLTGQYDHPHNPRSVQEALQWAGLDWEPTRLPIFSTLEHHTCQSEAANNVNTAGCDELATTQVYNNNEPPQPQWYACLNHATVAQSKGYRVARLKQQQLGDYFAVARTHPPDSDGNAQPPQVLNVANSTYEIFSNRETFELLELLLADENAPGAPVRFETGGSLRGGRLVWALASIDQPYEVTNRVNGNSDPSPIYPYVSVLNSHDGTAALRAIKTSIRIVCWNTFSYADNQATAEAGTKHEFSFRHTQTMRDRVEEAKQLLFTARTETERWVETANELIGVPISDKQYSDFLTDFVPMPPKPTDRSAANVEDARAAIKGYYHSPSTAAIAGTVWGALNSVTEYLDHGRTFRTKETYVSRTMLRPEKGKAQALDLLRETVGIDA